MLQTIMIPAPPVPLSASASLLQTVTINNQMRNITRSSQKAQTLGTVGEGESILLFDTAAQAQVKRIGPSAVRERFSQQMKYAREATQGVREELKPQGITAAQRLHAIEAFLEDQDLFVAVGGTAAIMTDPGRQRAMCSSPRDMAMRGVREIGIAVAAGATAFTTSYTSEHFLDSAAMAVSPKRALALHGSHIPGMHGFGMQDDSALSAELDPETLLGSAMLRSMQLLGTGGGSAAGDAAPVSPRAEGAVGGSAFRSKTARFRTPVHGVPPVGHYTTRYKAVDGEPRAPAFMSRVQERRGGSTSPHGNGGAHATSLNATLSATVTAAKDAPAPLAAGGQSAAAMEDSSTHLVQSQSPLTAAPPQQAMSSREVARLRLNSAPVKPAKHDPPFVSVAPRLAPPTCLPQSVKDVRKDFYPPVVAHDETNSLHPRVHAVQFKTMSPRTDSPRTKAEKARFPVFQYHVPDATQTLVARDVHFQVEFGSMASRGERSSSQRRVTHDRELKSAEALRTGSTLDLLDLVERSKVLSPRLLPADIAKHSPRHTVTGLEHQSDTLTDPEAIARHVFPKHTQSPQFSVQSPHRQEVRVSSCKQEVYNVNFSATTEDKRLRTVQVAGNQNHNDVMSFGNQANLRVAHGDIVDCVESPRIDATRPRTVFVVPDFCREGVLKRAGGKAAMHRPELENADPGVVRPRVRGDPQMGYAASRAQNEIRFPISHAPLDVLYDPKVSYTAELLKPTHVQVKIIAQVPRKQPASTRLAAQHVNLDPVPEGGVYDPRFHYLSASPPKGHPATATYAAT